MEITCKNLNYYWYIFIYTAHRYRKELKIENKNKIQIIRIFVILKKVEIVKKKSFKSIVASVKIEQAVSTRLYTFLLVAIPYIQSFSCYLQ